MDKAQQEIRRLHRVCREKDAAMKEVIIACRQAMISLNNQQQPTAEETLAWRQAVEAAEDRLG